jgi:sec-independent protein translocase protein TatB
MFNLDPGKLLVIGVIAVLLLGPDRLPHVARQVGGTWRSFNQFRQRMEDEVRSNIPDLPSTGDLARLTRSPSALLNHLESMGSKSAEHAGKEESIRSSADGGAIDISSQANGEMKWVTADYSSSDPPHDMSSSKARYRPDVVVAGDASLN